MDPEVLKHLADPFPADTINWKPQTISKNGERALAVAYIDARDVAERLDDVVGPGGWQVDHKTVGDQTLTGIGVLVDGTWIWKWDLGMVAQDSDEAKSAKGSLSDGLKRAAVLWGIGRYLYRLPKTWVGYDGKTKRITETPALPKWALPTGEQPRAPAPAPAAAIAAPASATPPTKNGNGKATSTTYWTRANKLIEHQILSKDEATAVLRECGGDFALAMQKLEEQYGH